MTPAMSMSTLNIFPLHTKTKKPSSQLSQCPILNAITESKYPFANGFGRVLYGRSGKFFSSHKQVIYVDE